MVYKKYVKRTIDIVLALAGLIVLSPVYVIVSLAIVIDDPGPVLFRQNRIGIHKTCFDIIKFRTMKMSTPHDIPTHLLTNPEQHITRIGGFLRKTSLDELPQIAQIFTGKMSIIGPRPALWNQYDLIAARDKYGANDVKPGLSGWAQVNGRDTVEIFDKARYDGDYAANITFKMDWTCFWMTVSNVLKRSGVVEGGTGVMAKQVKKRESEINNSILDETGAVLQHDTAVNK